jgi:dipeptidase E
MPGHVIATGAGRAMMDRHNDPLHEYILGLTGKERPRVLFLGTATGDDASYIVSFYEAYHADRCAPFHLRLFQRTVDDLRSFVLGCDVIHVGGGNTVNMLGIWRRHGLEDILREAWEGGTVLTGGSAGGMCWFQGGTTDSYGLPLQVLPDGLGIIDGSFCAHYDAEVERRPLFQRAVLDGALPPGYGVGNLVSLHFEGSRLVGAVSGLADGQAVFVEKRGNEIIETPLAVMQLPGSSCQRASEPSS